MNKDSLWQVEVETATIGLLALGYLFNLSSLHTFTRLVRLTKFDSFEDLKWALKLSCQS